jgi:hypothetical protein
LNYSESSRTSHSRFEERRRFAPPMAKIRDPYVDGPPLARGGTGFDRSDSDHMSGMMMRSHMTAAKMGSTARAPNILAVSCTDGSHGVLPRDCDRSIGSIFRSRASFGLGVRLRSASHRSSWSAYWWSRHVIPFCDRYGRGPDCVIVRRRRLSAARKAGQGWPEATAAGGA